MSDSTTEQPAQEPNESAAVTEPTAATDTPETTEEVTPAAIPMPAANATPAAIPTPSAIPSPAALAGSTPKPSALSPTPAPVQVHTPSDSARFGRVDDEGKVFVQEGAEWREVGSFPGATPDEALQYFARKYDELYATVDLLFQRMQTPEVTVKELQDGLNTVHEAMVEPNVVGDLAALAALLTQVEDGLAAKREAETARRKAAKAAAQAEREVLVNEAETIAATPENKVQWKQSSARMRELLDEWKSHQRSAARLDKDTEHALWQRFSKARNGFDKMRRAHFAQLEETRGAAKKAKEDLVAEAEKLAASTDWGPTASAFKRLMDRWRQAGRASRQDDDALWAKFKAAQDSFFDSKDRVAAEEDESYRANLEVKEALLVEAEKILPVKDIDRAKAQLRTIQDKWDKAGKVPRADIDRTEKAMRRIENAVRDAEESKWSKSNPEVVARASSMATQLEASVAKIEEDLAEAKAKGREKKVAELTAKLEAQQQWLAQARAGLDEFGTR